MPAVEHRFGTGKPFSLGVEEELCLVAPDSGRLRNSAPEVLDRLAKPAGTLAEAMAELREL